MADNILYYDNAIANQPTDVDRNGTIASTDSVMLGFIFQDAITREPLVGTMPENDSVYIVLEPSTSEQLSYYVIPEGHHSGTGMVVAPSISEYTYGTATAEDIAAGKYAWVNGEKIIGILDVRANAQEGNATADDLLSGKAAWVNGEKIYGTIPYLYRIDKTLLPGESYTIPYGLSSGESIITAADLSSQTGGDVTAADIAYGKTAWVNGEKVVGTYRTEDAIREWLSEAEVSRDYVLEGNKFYSTLYPDGVVEGTMVDHSGEETRTLLNGQTYYIPAGYYDGNVAVKVADISDATVANMEANDLLAGKTAWVNGVKVTGTMPYIDAVNEVVACSEVYIIPEGYHSGSGKVTGKDLASQTVADAQAKNILSGKTAWVNGTKLTGSMVYNTAEDIEILPGTNYIIPQGYHTGAGAVWTKSIADQTVGTAEASDMLEGTTAWVNGEEITGTIPVITGQSINLDGGDSYTIPAGYYDGTSVVTATGVADQTPGTATASDILINKTAWVNGEKITGTINLVGTAISVQVLKGKTFYNTDANQIITGELELTGDAEANHVLKGYKFYSNDPFTQLEGTLELTGDARTAHVLEGETFYTTYPDYKQTGTMVNNGAIIKGLESGESYTIPAGYHNGNGRVTAPSIESVTEGTASASDILASKTAWVDGTKLTGTLELTGDAYSENVLSGKTFYNTDAKTLQTGTMPNITDSNITLQAGEYFDIDTGYHSGARITAEELGDQTSGTATTTDILEGSTAWVNGVQITGVIPVNAQNSPTLLAGESYTVPYGYHDGTSIVYAEDLASQTVGSAGTNQILNTYSAWVNGEKLIGTMPNIGSESQSLNCGETHIISAGYHDGTGVIVANSLESQTVANAVAGEILNTKTAWVNGEKVTGTMPNIGSVSATLDAGDSYTIPAGYHDGTGVIDATGMGDQTPGTATAERILDTYTAWVNGSQITGTMPNIGSESEALNCGSTHTISKGYHDGTGVIRAASLASQTSATATAADILDTKTAWVSGVKLTGSMTNNGAITQTINAGATYTIPAGYHNGNGVITGASLDGQTPGSATASDMIEGTTAWVNGTQITGTIPVQNGSDTVLLAGERLNIPAGYYPNGFTVLAASLASQTDGTATAADIVVDETAWVKGNKITGIIPDGDSIVY